MANSYNGWPASPDPKAIGVAKFGDAQGFPFPGGVKSGDVFAVLGYVATQLHNRVEPCVGGWCWGYTYRDNVNNPGQLSCHASATAIDWCAPDHPNGSSGTFTSAQVGVIYQILDEVQGAVNWLEGYDEMHFEICVSASDLARVAATLPDAGPVPEPGPDPDEPVEDDDVYALYQVEGDVTVYVAAPGVFEGTPSQEYLDVLMGSGAARSPIVKVNQRALDILRDSYRRWPAL
jgi:hypothetical protein